MSDFVTISAMEQMMQTLVQGMERQGQAQVKLVSEGFTDIRQRLDRIDTRLDRVEDRLTKMEDFLQLEKTRH